MTNSPHERHLKVYADRSILVRSDGTQEEFVEGRQSEEARVRGAAIQDRIAGFLVERIKEALSDDPPARELDDDHRELIDRLVGGVTPEVGRALLGVSVAQVAAKAIEPDQSIRLHKGSRSSSFGWAEGISIRTISAKVAGILREYDLLRLNASGPMMTRTLAENYPYTAVYKADMRGPKQQWLEFVEAVETDALDPEAALEYLLLRLYQDSTAFEESAAELLDAAEKLLATSPSFEAVRDLIIAHVTDSTHSARLFEVSMHSLMQALEDVDALEGNLRPLVQMRTADLKAGKVADIELTAIGDDDLIIEAWDAKFGRPYLVDEVYELMTKLEPHPGLGLVGFVVNTEPTMDTDVEIALAELQSLFELDVEILSFHSWVERKIEDVDRDELAEMWLRAYAESLALYRREKAPIDEPTKSWVESLTELL